MFKMKSGYGNFLVTNQLSAFKHREEGEENTADISEANSGLLLTICYNNVSCVFFLLFSIRLVCLKIVVRICRHKLFHRNLSLSLTLWP